MADLQLSTINQVARFGEFTLDFVKMELCRSDQPVSLTLQEFKVLKFFLSKPEVVLSRLKLITAVWPKRKRSSHRTVDNCIAKLRQKIEQDPTRPVYLLTVHGVGYKFVPHARFGVVRPADFESGDPQVGARLPETAPELSGYSEQRRK